jgi:Tol biopolymer transport system component
MVCSCAAVHAGTILLRRDVNTTYNGMLMPTGSGLFTIADDGSDLQQLTPMKTGTWYVPSGVSYTAPGHWLTRNFSPDGRSILYFAGKASYPTDSGPSSGKYYTMNLRTGATHPLFDGNNDDHAPGVGALAWGPQGSDLIAYANSINGNPVTPACVYVMKPDGGDKHRLWCAPAHVSTPNGAAPTQAVETLRWAGNGKTLLAFVAYQPSGSPSYDNHLAAFLIDVQAGTAVEAADNIPSEAGDISYDGSKIIYQQWDGYQCGNEDPASFSGISLCVKDMRTGKVNSVLPPAAWFMWAMDGSWWKPYWYDELLLSPDGSQVAFMMKSTASFDADLYVINTDGKNLRQLTAQNPIPPADFRYVDWLPTAWSPDGTQILVNRSVQPSPESTTDATWPSEVHIINVNTGRDRLVTHGFAVSWYQP